jgi:hypothetical protein
MIPKTKPIPRAGLSAEELRQYAGKWIAWSADGTHVVAAAEDLLRLDELVRQAGEDPQLAGLERIEMEDFTTLHTI